MSVADSITSSKQFEGNIDLRVSLGPVRGVQERQDGDDDDGDGDGDGDDDDEIDKDNDASPWLETSSWWQAGTERHCP